MAGPFSSSTDVRRFQRRWTWWFTLVVLAIVALVRIRLMSLPLERDEGEYAYTGQLMLQGIPPYDLAYTMKFPGTGAMYALIMALFGQTAAGIHLGILCVTTLTALMLYGLGKKMFDPVAGMVAATAYAVMAASPAMLGLAGHATHFAAFFVTAGLGMMWKAPPAFRAWHVLAAGLLFGLAILMKQHAAFIAAGAAIAFSVLSFRASGFSTFRKLAVPAIFCIGVLLPFAFCCLVLWQAGVFPKFWFWTIDYARKYEVARSMADARLYFRVMVPLILSTTLCLWFLAAVELVRIWFDDRTRATRWWLAGFAIASALTVVPGFYFREHYFLLMLPAIALLAGSNISAAEQFCRSKIEAPRFKSLALFIYAAFLAAIGFNNSSIWWVKSPLEAAHSIYEDELFLQAPAVAEFVRTHSAPDARMAVLASEPEIYFLAGRRSVTGYLYTLALLEKQPFAQQMTREMIREIETNAPQFIVFTAHFTSWGGDPHADPIFGPWWQSYRAGYDLVGIVDAVPPTGTRLIEGRAAAQRDLKPGSAFEIYRRRDSVDGRSP